MKTSVINPLGEDAELFARMKDNYQSDNEREFFEKLLYKEQWEMSMANDVLLAEWNNEDDIYIIRCYYDEYIVGRIGKGYGEEHVMNLSEALNLNLKEICVLDEDITLFEWLRRRDYAGLDYNHDIDYL